MKRRSTTELLMHTGTRLSSIVSDRLVKDIGIGLNDWRVLQALTSAEPTSIATVCRSAGVHKSVVSRSLVQLEALRLITVQRIRRAVAARLLPAGEVVRSKGTVFVLEVDRHLFDGVALSAKLDLDNVLERIDCEFVLGFREASPES